VKIAQKAHFDVIWSPDTAQALRRARQADSTNPSRNVCPLFILASGQRSISRASGLEKSRKINWLDLWCGPQTSQALREWASSSRFTLDLSASSLVSAYHMEFKIFELKSGVSPLSVETDRKTPSLESVESDIDGYRSRQETVPVQTDGQPTSRERLPPISHLLQGDVRSHTVQTTGAISTMRSELPGTLKAHIGISWHPDHHSVTMKQHSHAWPSMAPVAMDRGSTSDSQLPSIHDILRTHEVPFLDLHRPQTSENILFPEQHSSGRGHSVLSRHQELDRHGEISMQGQKQYYNPSHGLCLGLLG
jgi:hypothetical protein